MSGISSRQIWHPEEESLSGALRLAKFFLGGDGDATGIVRKAFSGLCGKPEALEPVRCRILFFHRILRSLPGHPKAPPGETQDGLSPLRTLPPASCAPAALFYLTDLPPAEMGRVLGIKPGALASQLGAVRRGFGVDVETSGGIAAPVFTRPGADSGQPGEAALFSAAKALGPDEQERAALAELALEFAEHPHSKMRMKDPAFLAMILAVLLFVGICAWILLAERPGFEGREMLSSLLLEGARAEASDFQPLDEKLPALEDWLVLNGIETFFVPPELQNVRSVAVRAFTFESHKVAAVAVPELNMMVYFLDVPGAGPGDDRRWHFFQAGPDAGAAIRSGRSVCVAAIRGEISELQNLLKTTNRPAPSGP